MSRVIVLSTAWKTSAGPKSGGGEDPVEGLQARILEHLHLHELDLVLDGNIEAREVVSNIWSRMAWSRKSTPRGIEACSRFLLHWSRTGW